MMARLSESQISTYVVVPALPRAALVEWQTWGCVENDKFECKHSQGNILLQKFFSIYSYCVACRNVLNCVACSRTNDDLVGIYENVYVNFFIFVSYSIMYKLTSYFLQRIYVFYER